jgi:hypothetical protein
MGILLQAGTVQSLMTKRSLSTVPPVDINDHLYT